MGKSNKAPRIFVSYAHEDYDFAEKLYRDLSAACQELKTDGV